LFSVRTIFCAVILCGVFSVANVQAIKSQSQDNGILYRYSNKEINLYLRPLNIAFSQGNEVDIGVDYPIHQRFTIGAAFRYKRNEVNTSVDPYIYGDFVGYGTGIGTRIQTEYYITDDVFNDSWVVNVNYSLHSVSIVAEPGSNRIVSDRASLQGGFGLLAGYRYFWSNYGQTGLNLGLLGGFGSEGAVTIESTQDGYLIQGVVPKTPVLRIDLGIIL
jgi:hypothetical protein